MPSGRAIIRCVLLVGLACAPTAFGQEKDADLAPLIAIEKAIQKVSEKVEHNVVAITVSRTDLYQRFGKGSDREFPGKLGIFDANWIRSRWGISDLKEQDAWLRKLDLTHPDHVPQGIGSGIVLDGKQGLILTNFHVVQDATKILVRLIGGKSSYADIWAGDARCDLAILRLLNPRVLPISGPSIELAGARLPKRGSFVISVSNQIGAGFRDGQCSISLGIVSNLRRRGPVSPSYEDGARPLHNYSTLIQTDARLHLGSSGGGLFDLQGRLVGITSALAGIQGGETPGGFAVPINEGMQRLISVLIKGEEIDYGLIGITFKSYDRDTPASVDSVTPGSPADLEAKLSRGDEIVAINGAPVRDLDDLHFRLSSHLAGSKISLQIRRPKQIEPVQVEVTLAKLNVQGKRIVSSLGSRPFVRGVRVDYSSLAYQHHLGGAFLQMPQGVWIAEVRANSAASRANLKTGDIITHVNRQPVMSPQAFYAAMENVGDNALEFTMYSPSPMGPPLRIQIK